MLPIPRPAKVMLAALLSTKYFPKRH